jgi:ribonuclease-3
MTHRADAAHEVLPPPEGPPPGYEAPIATAVLPLTKQAVETDILGFRVLSWPGAFLTAFTHKTAAGLPGAGDACFEKLEFLGDSVLGFIVARYLYETYPTANEGFLTQMRTKLVSGKALAGIAHRMGLSRYVIMSSKALRSGFNSSPRILEDVLESLIGAVFLDSGMVAARSFVLAIIHKHIDHASLKKNYNFKDSLMQFCQATRGQALPVYDSRPRPVESGGGFDVVAAACGARGQGSGKTKREAEQAAARAVLVNLGAPVDS